MEAGSIVMSSSSSSSSTNVFSFNNSRFSFISKTSSPALPFPYGGYGNVSFPKCNRESFFFCCRRRTSPLTIAQVVENPPATSNFKDLLPKIDKSGRFCSPRAARELALMTVYAACLQGSDPVSLFDKRMNARREIGYEFDKRCLVEYDHMSFGGPPVTTETTEEADEILRNDQKESDIEAEVLSAPPKLVYSKLILRFARKLLVAVAESWDSNVLAIDKVAPQNWKSEPAGRILEFSLLHLAMSEIAVLGTRHQIVINEVVDLAKRFCDGAAPRIINGCLRTYVKDLRQNGEAEPVLKVKLKATV
ncbi:hypothetical protein ACS0TY_006447 [Phlomoides rotata]